MIAHQNIKGNIHFHDQRSQKDIFADMLPGVYRNY